MLANKKQLCCPWKVKQSCQVNKSTQAHYL
uniref:Uncharacterized protein n=1 Tax=Siphoviridae sp. ctgaY24 TaxID=2827911 RepID=A0A8S5SBF4_9CAUD|nr:MAG TPA: hypothetical protein [Siphoviridae sp. ctgaY24]DAN17654.1 MAG TPA: hypothetical protein [Caudoviricetes sp.]